MPGSLRRLTHPPRVLLVGLAAACLALTTGGAATAATSAAVAPRPVAQVDPWLAGQLLRTPAAATVSVLVHPADRAVATSAAAVSAVGATSLTTYPLFGTTVARATPAQVVALEAIGGLAYLEGGDQPLVYDGHTGPETIRTPQAAANFAPAPGVALDGKGVGVAIVDSGIAGDHRVFADKDGNNRIVRSFRVACSDGSTVCTGTAPGAFTNDAALVEVPPATDTDTPAAGGHGTHVAGIAAGLETTTSTGEPFRGEAPASSLYVFGTGAALSIQGASTALNWIATHSADPCFNSSPRPAVCPAIKVINNSYGPAGGGEYNPTAFNSQVTNYLAQHGVVVVWAAGNGDAQNVGGDGSDNRTNPPGESPVPGVLMVANYDDAGTANRDNTLDSSSSRGNKGRPQTYPDFSAPGANILSACRASLNICRGTYTDDLDFGVISGTSMATPQIVGIVALLFQYQPSLTPAQIEYLLEDTAHKFGDPSSYEEDISTQVGTTNVPPDPGQPRNPTAGSTTSFDKGHGLVDLTAAIAKLSNQADPGLPALCQADAAFGDPAGDATDFLVATGGAAPNEPSLDILRVFLSESAGVLSYHVKVADLVDTAPTGSSGRYVRMYFTYKNVEYTAIAQQTYTGLTPAYSYSVSTPGATAAMTNTLVIPGLGGTFDSVADEIRIDIPLAAFNAAAFPTKPADRLGAGSVLLGLNVLTQRQEVRVTPSADTAAGACNYRIQSALLPAVIPEGTGPLRLLASAIVLGGGASLIRRRRRTVAA